MKKALNFFGVSARIVIILSMLLNTWSPLSTLAAPPLQEPEPTPIPLDDATPTPQSELQNLTPVLPTPLPASTVIPTATAPSAEFRSDSDDDYLLYFPWIGRNASLENVLTPIAAFQADQVSGEIPLTVTFSNMASGPIMTRTWHFGDGTTTISNALTATHTYTKSGVYTVSLAVTDGVATDIQTRTHYITAADSSLTQAGFTASPYVGTAPLTVSFLAPDTSKDPNVTYAWAFGDGTTGAGVTSTHVYSQPGSFTVTLTTQTLTDTTIISRPYAVYVGDPYTMTVQSVTTQGGQLVSNDGLVQVIFPPDAITRTHQMAYLAHTRPEVLTDSINIISTIEPAAEGTPYYIFDLESLTAGTSYSKTLVFAKPVSLSVKYNQEAIRTYDEEALSIMAYDHSQEQWLPVPTHVNTETMMLTAVISHFSQYGVGGDTAAWVGPSINGADVNLAKATADFSYPISIPAGVSGPSTPNLTLQYSSGMVNSSGESGWLGQGWLLELGEIRDNHLTLDSLSADLERDVAGDTTFEGFPAWRYQTKRENFALIYRVFANPSYWVVIDKSGTRYEFGRVPNSQLDWCSQEDLEQVWKLNQITDLFGNSQSISYQRYPIGAFHCKQKWSYPTEIRYTLNDQLSPADSHAEYRVTFETSDRDDDGGQQQLDKISVFHHPLDGGQQLIRQYKLHYTDRNEERYTLDRIEQFGTSGEGGGALPAMQFRYEPYETRVSWRQRCINDHRDQWDNVIGTSVHLCGWGSHRSERYFLQEIDNGFGGSIRFGYVSEKRPNSDSVHWHRVATKEVNDAVTGQQATYTYQFPNGPVYEEGKDIFHYGRFAGFGKADVVAPAPFSYRSRHYFHTIGPDGQKNNLTGIEFAAYQFDGANNLYNASHTDWEESDSGFVYSPSQRSYQCEGQTQGETLTGCLMRQIAREFDLTTGSVTSQTAFDAAGQPYRQTETTYFNNTTGNHWLLGLPREEIVTVNSEIVAHSQYYYDNYGGLSNPALPTKGALTLQRVISGSQYLDTTTIYNKRGKVDRQLAFNSYGQTNQVANSDVREVVTTYDEYGLLPVEVTNSKGHQAHTAYDLRFQAPLTETDPNDNTVTYNYDQFGRLVSVTLPGCDGIPTFVAEYDDSARPYREYARQQIDDCSGGPVYAETAIFYDGFGRKIQDQTQGDNNDEIIISNAGYDVLGRLNLAGIPYTVDAPLGNYQPPNWTNGATETTFDLLDRPQLISAPDGSLTKHTYDLEIDSDYSGVAKIYPLATVIDGNGHTRHFMNDEWGNLIRVREFTGTDNNNYALYAETIYRYDGRNSLVHVEDAGGNGTHISYDALGRKIAMDDPDLGRWTYSYNVIGNLIRQMDAKGIVTELAYDSLGRLTSKQYSDNETPAVTYLYDQGENGIGQRTGMTDGAGSVTWTHDERGRAFSESRQFNATYSSLANPDDPSGVYTIRTNYNAADWVTALTYPDSETVDVNYTRRGLPQTLVSDQDGQLIAGAIYNSLAQLTSRQAGNGLTTLYDYYSAQTNNNRLAKIQVSDDATSYLDLTYDYDAVGNITTMTDNSAQIGGQQFNFSYDHLDRLVTANAAAGLIPGYDNYYSYDRIGNITNKTIDDELFTYSYDPNHPHAAVGMGENQYAYDANGNMTERVEDGITYLQEWNAFNKLERVTWTDDEGRPYTTTFVYDGDGNRLLKIEALPGPTTHEITTLYISQLYERQVDTTAEALAQLASVRVADDANDLLALSITDRPKFAASQATNMSEDLTPRGGGLSSPLLLSYSFSDDFNSLNTNHWRQWSEAGIALYTSGGGFHATRGSTYSPDWNESAGIALKQKLNFSGQAGTTVQWRGKINEGSVWGLMHSQIIDEDAQRYFDFDCSATTSSGNYTCSIFFRNSYDHSYIWIQGLGTVFERDRFYTFEMRYLGAQTVAFYVDGQHRATNTFSSAEWNNIDWVEARWMVVAWAGDSNQPNHNGGNNNIINATLDYFSFTQAQDNDPPLVTVTGLPHSQWTNTSQEITYQGSDSQSGFKCIRASWDQWPSNDSNCYTASGIANASHEGARTLYIRAWDWAGNQTTWAKGYYRDTTAPPIPTLNSEPTYTADGENTISWPAVTDAGIGNVQYRVQVATNSTFSGAATSNWQTGLTKSYIGLSDCQAYYYRAQSKDGFNYTSAWSNWVSSIQDHSAPTGSIQIENDAAVTSNQNVTMWLSANDCMPADQLQMRFKNEASVWSEWVNYQSIYNGWHLSDQDGQKTVSVQFRDSLGHVSNTFTDTILFDGNSPAITSFNLTPNPTNGPITVTATISDAGNVTWDLALKQAGTVITQTSGSDKQLSWYWPASDSADDLYTLILTATDSFGNPPTVESLTFTLDQTAPSLNLYQPGTTRIWDAAEIPVLAETNVTLNGLRELAAGDRAEVDHIELWHEGGQPITATLQEVNGTAGYSGTLTELLPNTLNTIYVYQEDVAGNSSTITRSLYVDTAQPFVDNYGPVSSTNEVAPVVSGQFVTPGGSAILTSSVAIYLDGKLVQTPIITPGGFFATLTEPLAEGNHTVLVQFQNEAGHQGQTQWAFSVDNSTWIAVDNPQHQAIFNHSSITVTGRSEAGNVITLTLDNSFVDTTSVADGGLFAFTDTDLTEGVHQFDFKAVDLLGNIVETNRSISVDFDGLAVSIAAQPNRFAPFAPFNNTANFSIKTAAPSGDELAAWQFQIWDNNVVVTQSAGYGPPPATLRWDGRDMVGQIPVEDHSYQYVLSITSTQGLSVTTLPQSITLNVAPPDKPIILTPTTSLTQGRAAIDMAGLAPGADMGDRVVIWLQDDEGNPLWADDTTVKADGQWSVSQVVLNSGSNLLWVTVTDSADQESVPSDPVTVTVRVLPPLKAIDRAPFPAGLNDTLVFTATARGYITDPNDEDFGLGQTVKVETAIDSPTGDHEALNFVAIDPMAPTSVWTVARSLADFTGRLEAYDVGITGLDADGNRQTSYIGIRIDGVRPATPVVLTPGFDQILNDETYVVRGTADPGSTVILFVNGQPFMATAGNNLGVWEIEVGLTAGDNVLQAQAVDDARNASSLSEAVVLTRDVTPPDLAAQIQPAFQKVGQPVTITAVVTETGSMYLGYVWAKVDGPDPASKRNLTDVGPEWQTTFVGGLEGVYTATVSARDQAGNIADATGIPFILDSTPPSMDITITAAPPYGYVQTDTLYYGEGSGSFTVTATAADSLAGLDSIAFPATTAAGQLYGLNGMTNAIQAHTYAFDSNDDLTGSRVVTATDRAGNLSTHSLILFNDTLAPTAAITTPANSGLRVSVAWFGADDLAGIRDFDIQYKEGTGLWTPWLSTTTVLQADFIGEAGKTYTFRVRAFDNVANVSAWAESAPVAVSAVTKYYQFGGERVAMRQGDALYYLHGDHLGSSSLTTDSSGAIASAVRYLPFGQQRWADGESLTDFGYTNQRQDSFGLLDYNARYYSSALSRFISADSIVPGPENPQSLNRYSYVDNNPIRFNDPSGHCKNAGSDANGELVFECNDADGAPHTVYRDDQLYKNWHAKMESLWSGFTKEGVSGSFDDFVDWALDGGLFFTPIASGDIDPEDRVRGGNVLMGFTPLHLYENGQPTHTAYRNDGIIYHAWSVGIQYWHSFPAVVEGKSLLLPKNELSEQYSSTLYGFFATAVSFDAAYGKFGPRISAKDVSGTVEALVAVVEKYSTKGATTLALSVVSGGSLYFENYRIGMNRLYDSNVHFNSTVDGLSNTGYSMSYMPSGLWRGLEPRK